MSKAEEIRTVIASQGAQSIDSLAAVLPYPRRLVAKWVWDMEKKGTLKREGDLFVLGRLPMSRRENALRSGFGRGRNAAAPVPRDELWRAWRDHPVPAFARGHLSPLIRPEVAA